MMLREGNVLRVSGSLTMDSIGALYGDAMQPLEGKEWTVDLAQVESADSSAVSMLLGWMRNAQGHGAKLTFINVPGNLLSLASLYGVADALQLNHPSN
ncbi:MAG: STAS domain-containing protein [Gallionellaceae bacterium]|nr:STAS domain-containing protein [Gallionellaceae bacterium]